MTDKGGGGGAVRLESLGETEITGKAGCTPYLASGAIKMEDTQQMENSIQRSLEGKNVVT